MQTSDTYLRDTSILLMGAAIGAGLAAILTPRSGQQTRQHLKSMLQQGKEHVNETAQEMAQQVTGKVEAAREEITGPDRLSKRKALEEGLGEDKKPL